MEDITSDNIPKPERRNGYRYLLPLFGAVMMAIGMFVEWWLLRPEPLTPGQRKLNEILDIISEQYVDEIDIDSIIELSIPGLINSLDPHSIYIPVSDRESIDGELEGSFSGVGIEFRIENDKIVVAEVIPGGPSEKVGLLPGDRIVEIDGETVANVGINEEGVRNRLRGEKGSKVSVKVERDNVKTPITFDIVRGSVPMTSIDATYMLDNNTGYIKVNRFSRTTYPEFLQGAVELLTQGAKDFVIDLRGNMGGYMEPALLMANEFLPAGRTIVSTRGRDKNMDDIVISDGTGSFQNVPLVIIVDELTASASEIFSGAIQDNDRGIVLGRRTFGKGLVQQPIELKDGSELRLTVQRYYTPSGRSIQKNYTRGRNDEYEEELFERYRSGELHAIDSTKINKDLIFHSIGGRVLYGGGGIYPDIFVANDSIGNNPYLVDVVSHGLLQKFASEYVSLNRPSLMKAKDIDSFLKLLPSDEVLLWSFADYAKMNGVAPRWYYINNSADIIVTNLKALIAYDILGRSAYFRISGQLDNTVSKALETINSGKANFPIK